MENSHKFFKNIKCKYFPCHEISDNDNFNCLLCYCPLYFLGDKCGGNFKYDDANNVKNCIDCHLPHTPKYYDVIVLKLKEVRKKGDSL